jgi:hypothetical protein
MRISGSSALASVAVLEIELINVVRIEYGRRTEDDDTILADLPPTQLTG